MEMTKVYLNTWGAYNDGCIGYGWMTPQEAIEFMENNADIDGGEFFIADIDNYLGVEFGNLEYSNVSDICETIETLENMNEYERDNVIALMEYLSTKNVQEAIDELDNYIFYSDLEEYHNSCDELIEMDMKGASDLISRYFDYDAYHRDCDFDVYEASNDICIAR